jgi:hypothetical protein
VLSLGDAKEATPTINKTLNPEWNTVLDLPIVGEQSLLLEVCCWDKDRFGKDYMGEFDVILEDLALNARAQQEPRWYPLESRRSGKKKSVVTGEIQIQFSVVDTSNPSAPPQQLLEKFIAIAGGSPSPDEDEADMLLRADSNNTDAEDDESSDEAQDESKKAEKREKRRKRLRMARLKKKAKQMSGYEYSSTGDIAGVLFLEIQRVTDLPPEHNGEYHPQTALHASSQQPSDTHLVRHGPLRRDLARQEDVPHEDGQPQPQPRVRREAGLPSPAPRGQLLGQLHSHRQGQVLGQRLRRHRQLPARKGRVCGAPGRPRDRALQATRAFRLSRHTIRSRQTVPFPTADVSVFVYSQSVSTRSAITEEGKLREFAVRQGLWPHA